MATSSPSASAAGISLDAPLHPRPQLRRAAWQTLDGEWRFAFDHEGRWRLPDDVAGWTHTIQVPFAPESRLSGVDDPSFHSVCWYQRDFSVSPLGGRRLLLHFGAVDYVATVWVNGRFVGSHTGGHTPFTFDVTPMLHGGETMHEQTQTLTVRAEDDPADLAKPRGKQDWLREPHSIWYPRTTGIWQPVWLEAVPETHIERIRWTPHLERWEIGFEAFLNALPPPGHPEPELTIRLRLSVGDQVLVRDGYNAAAREVHRRIALSDPGIDDSRNTLLWSPEKPTLIRAEVELCRGDEVLDRVESYTALRSVSVRQGDFLLNGRPYYLRLVLDQGYWPESLMSPPTEAALRRDVELAKAMGFNGVRKHQKIEDPRYLYWADVLGLLVWEEMPSAYRFTHDGVERVTREWIEVLDRDYNHPCIVTWVPFNESWGVPDLPETAAHRNWVQSLYHLTKTLDPTRPVVGNDGWESSATDIIGIHDYDCDPQRMRERYDSRSPLAAILNRRSPAGRLLTVEGYAASNQPVMLTEFGGIAFATRGDPMKTVAWGYEVSESEGDLEKRYGELLAVVHSLKHFRGFCYTQFADTFQEANGLLFADRRPKLPLTELAAITRGCVHHGVIPEQPVLESGDGAECPR